MLNQLFRVLKKKQSRKMPIMMIGKIKIGNKVFIELAAKKPWEEMTSLEFLGWNWIRISVQFPQSLQRQHCP